MDRNKELAKNTIILTVGKICTQFVSFFLLPLYTSLLTPEEYGIVDLFNTYTMLLVPLFNLQLESGLFRFMLDYRDDKKKQSVIFSTVLIANIVQIIIYLVFFLVFQNFIHSEYKNFLAFDVICSILLNTFLQFPRGRGENMIYSAASCISASATIILNVVFIVGIGLRAYGLFLATIIAKILTILYLIISTRAWGFFSVTAFDKKLLKNICKYSIPLVPNQLSWWVVGASDRTIISHVIGVTANGIYSVANKFSTVYMTFYNIFNLSWTETVSLHMFDSDRDLFLTETINTMFKLFASVCVGIIACMPFVFPVLVNNQYATAYYQIPILMVAVLFQVMVGLYSAVYVALKKSIEIAKTSFLAAIINIIVDVLLIKFIGIFAASISTLVAYATMAIYRYVDIRKYAKIELQKKTLLLTTIILLVTLYSYYSGNILLRIVSLLIVVLYSFIINRSFLRGANNMIKNKINNILGERHK